MNWFQPNLACLFMSNKNKKNKSTSTAGCLLQSLISRAADDNCYVAMASMDLSFYQLNNDRD